MHHTPMIQNNNLDKEHETTVDYSNFSFFFTDLFLPFIKERVVPLLTDWTIQEWSLTQVHVQKELKSLVGGGGGVGLGGVVP